MLTVRQLGIILLILSGQFSFSQSIPSDSVIADEIRKQFLTKSEGFDYSNDTLHICVMDPDSSSQNFQFFESVLIAKENECKNCFERRKNPCIEVKKERKNLSVGDELEFFFNYGGHAGMVSGRIHYELKEDSFQIIKLEPQRFIDF